MAAFASLLEGSKEAAAFGHTIQAALNPQKEPKREPPVQETLGVAAAAGPVVARIGTQ